MEISKVSTAFSPIRQTLTLDSVSQPGAILLHVNGTAASLTWAGDGNAATSPDFWDVNTSANWVGGQTFFHLDNVTFDDSGATASPNVVLYTTLDPGTSVTVNNSAGHDYSFTGTGGITGVSKLVKTGTGTLNINANYAVIDFSGGTTISQGAIIASPNNISHLLGSGPITLGDSNTGSADVAFYLTGSSTGTYTIANPILVTAQGLGAATIGATSPSSDYSYEYLGLLTLNRPTTLANIGTAANLEITYSGSITGQVGLLTVTGGNKTFFGNSNTFTGNVAITGAGTILYLQDTLHGDAIPDTSSVDVGAGAQLYVFDSNETIDGLSGSGTIAGNNLTIGARGGSGTFSGAFQLSGSSSITKVGLGVETLSGMSASSGPINVNGGTLLVTGNFSSDSTVISAGGLLAGTGRAGALTLNSGGLLSPGPGIGTLTASQLTWNGGGILDFDLGDGNNSDLLSLGSGQFAKGAAGPFLFDFGGSGENNSVYVLMTFGSTTFAATDFAYENLAPDLTGTFQVTSNSLELVTTPEPGNVLLLCTGTAALFGFRPRRSKPLRSG